MSPYVGGRDCEDVGGTGYGMATRCSATLVVRADSPTATGKRGTVKLARASRKDGGKLSPDWPVVARLCRRPSGLGRRLSGDKLPTRAEVPSPDVTPGLKAPGAALKTTEQPNE